MKVTILVDNVVAPGTGPYLAEHGFAALLEFADRKILVDTGQSGIVVQNLATLGMHCNELDAIVLSHGHYDHTGGLLQVLKQRREAIPVYAHEELFSPHYAKRSSQSDYVGIPYVKEQLTALGAEWNFLRQLTEIFPRLWFSGSIPRRTDFETGDAKLVSFDPCGCRVHDTVIDDSSLYYASPQGLVVISGCAHSGVVNTVQFGKEVTGLKQLAGWIGGTHLGPVTTEQWKKTVDFLTEQQPAFLATSHCTGFAMMSKLHQRLPEQFVPAFVGTVIDCG